MGSTTLPSDDILIPRLLEGDETAFNQVVSAHHRLMVQVARAIVGDSIAEEVAQEAWVAAIKSLPKFERRSSLKTWILRIVSNCAKSRLRHESRKVSMADPLEDITALNANSFKPNGHWQKPPNMWSIDTPEEILASKELNLHITQAIKDLPPLQQAALTLRDTHGLDMDEICKILEVSESNARVLLHRARNQLREMIDQFQGNL